MAAYRRRPDGILEILRPHRPSRLRAALASAASALSLALVPAVAVAVLVSVGMPILVVAAAAILVLTAWLSTREPAISRAEPVLRLADAAGQQRARSGSRVP